MNIDVASFFIFIMYNIEKRRSKIIMYEDLTDIQKQILEFIKSQLIIITFLELFVDFSFFSYILTMNTIHF